MNKGIIAGLVTLAQLSTIAFGDSSTSPKRDALQKIAFDRLDQCTEIRSDRMLNERSILDSIMMGFRNVYPDVCIETVSSWYRGQLTELAANEPTTSDSTFRENRQSLMDDLESFQRSVGSSHSPLTKTVRLYSETTRRDGEEKGEIPLGTVRGYITVSQPEQNDRTSAD